MNQNLKRLSSEHKENRNQSGDGSQDWVCLKCNNLNYSFRTKCNRCKLQSREDNQQELYADYYYNHYYGYHNASQIQLNGHQDKGISQTSRIQTPQKRFSMSESYLSIREEDQLPSVSPLIKRYKARQQITTTRVRKGVFGQKLFETQTWNDQQLPLIDISDASKDLCLTDDEQASEQFTKIVQQMIL